LWRSAYEAVFTLIVLWILGRHKKIEIMQGKMLRQVLDKMMKHGTAQNARVQVCLPDGKFYDISSLQLMENKLIGVRESHRLVFTVQAETWNMGKILKKIG